MKWIFGLIYTVYFGIHAYYTQADHLTGDPLEVWGKVWMLSNDVMKGFLALLIYLGYNDGSLRKSVCIALIYEITRIVFDVCWL